MPFSEKPWGQFSESDYKTAEQFCDASLIDLNPPGKKKIKSLCKLPVKEPGGMFNKNGLKAAAARLAGAGGGVDAPPEAKQKAARKLIRLYREADMEPPASILRIAGE